jgi:hypothetical protein
LGTLVQSVRERGIIHKKVGPDFPGETFRVLKDKEEREFGEYRTRRLVLKAWDRFGGR